MHAHVKMLRYSSRFVRGILAVSLNGNRRVAFFGGGIVSRFFLGIVSRFLGFDGFHWYLQRFAAKLSDLHVVVVFLFLLLLLLWLW
jgi:hypothetical protein